MKKKLYSYLIITDFKYIFYFKYLFYVINLNL